MINYQIGKLYKLSYKRSIYEHDLYRNYLDTIPKGQIVFLLKQEKLPWCEWAFKILTSNGIVGWIRIEANNICPPFKEIKL
jgi:hypothetical protein